MGYYTNYYLDIHEGNKTIEEVLNNIDESEFEGIYYSIDEYGDTVDAVKWYNHEDDMKKFSKLYPELVFVLKGEGEESGDVWRKYFKNGKMHSCYVKLVFDDYDENKLL